MGVRTPHKAGVVLPTTVLAMILILHRYQIAPVSLYIPPLDGGDGQRILKAPHRTVHGVGLAHLPPARPSAVSRLHPKNLNLNDRQQRGPRRLLQRHLRELKYTR